MEISLFNKDGNAVAYISDDSLNTIYLWEGYPVAYVFQDRHIYGINGRHLGWMIDQIIYNNKGERIGFTSGTCPVPPDKETTKPKKYPRSEDESRWEAPPLPKLEFHFTQEDFSDFLKEGEPYNPRKKPEKEEVVEEDDD